MERRGGRKKGEKWEMRSGKQEEKGGEKWREKEKSEIEEDR